MKKKFTFLTAAIVLLALVILPKNVVGQTRGYTELFTITSADVVNNSGYAAYTYTDGSSRSYVITFGGNNKSVGTNSNKRSSCTLSSYSKYAVSPVTTSDIASAFVTTTSISNVSKISYKHSGGSSDGSTKVYLIYSSDNNTFSKMSLTSGTQGADIDNGSNYVNFEFTPCSGYFGLLFKTTTTSGAWRIDDVEIKFYKTTYTVTYHANGATNGTVPATTTHNAGANVTVAEKGDLEKTNFIFSNWNTEEDGSGDSYDAGTDVIKGISADVNLYAQWTAATNDPYFVVANVNLDASATEGTISYEVKKPVSGGTVSAACTPENGWISDVTVTNPSSNNNTVTFTTSVNAAGERVGTIRLTYTYDTDKTITADVTVTQATSTRTITYQANGGSGSNVVKTYDYGTNVTILAYNDPAIGFTAPEGSYFKNWKDGNSTTYSEGAIITSIAANYTLSAQWEAFPIYYLVTSSNQIVAGKHYVIASSAEESDAYGIGAPNGTYRDRTPVTISTDTDDNLYITKTAYLCDFVLSGKDSDDKWTLYDKTNGVYLYGGSKGTLGGNDGSTEIPATAKFSLTLTNDGDIEFSNNDFIIEYNGSNNPRFASYASTMSKVYLYVKDNDRDLEIYSPTTIASNKIVDCDTYTLGNNKASLTIADGGQLICNNAVNATVKKSITGYGEGNGKWYFIASPLESQFTLDGSDMVDGTYDLYRLNNTTWENYENAEHAADFITLNNGYGCLYANENDINLSFAGAIKPYSEENNANQKALSAGWNLIGNPYTFNIYIDKPYYKMNSTGSDVEPVENYWEAANFIPAGTGIVVYAESAGTVTFSKTAPSAPTPAAGNHGSLQMTLIKDNMRGNAVQDKAVVSFNEDVQLGKFVFNENNSKLYIPKNGEDYAIAFSDRQGDMDLNFKASELGTYTISFEGVDMDLNGVYLIDILEQREIDLSVNPSYTFMGSPADRAARFKIVFRTTGFENAPSDIFAYQNGNEIVVSGEGELQVFDVTGRKVISQHVNGVQTMCTSSLQTGVYIFRMNEKVQKIVVR